MTSPPSRLWAALSPAAPPVLAVLDPHHTASGEGGSLRVLLYDAGDSAAAAPSLLMTLTHRLPEDDGADDDEGAVRALFFAGADGARLCAATRRGVVAWDVARGVATGILTPGPGLEVRHACRGADDGTLLLLVAPAGPAAVGETAVEDTRKCQVHVYDAAASRLLRKVKVGRAARQIAAATSPPGAVLVRTVHAVKLIDTQTGRKLHKFEPFEGGEEDIDDDALNGLAATQTGMTATLAGNQLLLMDLQVSGRSQVRRLSLPGHTNASATDGGGGGALQLVPVGSNDNSLYLVAVSADLFVLDLERLDDAGAALRLACRVSGARGLVAGPDLVAAVVEHDHSPRGELGVVIRHLDRILPSEDDPMPRSWDLAAPTTGQSETDAADKSGKKRRKSGDILGPGQAGGEARHVTELAATKRSKADMESDMDKDDGDDEEDGGPTVEERLAQLQKALDEESDQEDMDEAEQTEIQTSFVAKRATTESLSQLLQQALQSGDDQMLELALQVRDKNVIEESCRDLSSAQATMLLTALTTRLAMKPGRADHMCSWLSILLQANKVKSVEHLQPLQNLLQERIEIFPALLKLEGRLAMMGSS